MNTSETNKNPHNRLYEGMCYSAFYKQHPGLDRVSAAEETSLLSAKLSSQEILSSERTATWILWKHRQIHYFSAVHKVRAHASYMGVMEHMRTLLATSLLFLLTLNVRADSWANPKVTRYFSEDSSYMLKVVPQFIPKKYYKWVMAKPKKKKRFSAQDTTIIPCHAILFKVNGPNDTIEVWNKKLINQVSPVSALVSNDGTRVITLDNWHSMGYGLDVFAVYNELGELVKRHQLDDFSVFPLNNYMISVSSIWWRCGAELLNERGRIKLCMQTEDERTGEIYYNLQTFEFEKAP